MTQVPVSEYKDWPPVVQARAAAVIKLTDELRVLRKQVLETNIDMLAPEKIKQLFKLGELHHKLAGEYKNLAKELAYHLSTTKR